MDKTGSLYFEGGIDVKKLYSTIDQINNKIGKMADNAENESARLDSMFDGMITGATAFLSLNFAKQIGSQIISVTGEFEQLGVALETILGSKAKADALMAQVVETASTTPFELTDVATGTKQLLAYGFAAEDIIGNIRMLGDVASGVSAPIGDLVYLYGTLRTQGRAYTRDIMQFTSRGIPIIRELANNLGVSESEVQKLVEAGKVGFPEVEKAFQNLTKEGGMFFNLMDKQSATITGMLSNLQDNIDKMMNSIGSANSGFIKSGITGLNELVENYEDVLKILGLIIATYGSYRAAIMLAHVAQKALTASENIAAFLQLAKSIRSAKDAQLAFSLVSKANPYALIVAGIGAVISALILFKDKTDKMSESYGSFRTELSNTTSEIDKNFKRLTETKEGTDQRRKAIEDINSEYGKYLTNLLNEKSSLEDIKKAQDEATESMAKNLAFKAQQSAIEDTKKTADEAANSFYSLINDLSNTLTNEQAGKFKAAVDSYVSELRTSFDQTGEFASISAKNIRSIFETSGGEMSLLNSGDIQNAQYAARDLVRTQSDLDNSTKNLEAQYNSYLEALGLTSSKTKESTTDLKTVQKQIDETVIAIKEAKDKLDEFRSPESTKTDQDIKDQVKIIEDLEKKLEVLTGVKRKEIVKQIKDEQDRIKALQDLADKELDMNRNLEDAKISILRNGIKKRELETTLSYKRQIDAIKKEERDYLSTLNKSKGLKSTDEGYVTELPANIQAKFDQQREFTTRKYYQSLATITKNAAQELKNIWSDVSDDFISDQDRQKRAINDRYNELIKKAKELGASESFLSDLNNKRQASLSNVVVVDWIDAFGDLNKVSTDAIKTMRDKLKNYIDQLNGNIKKDELKELVRTFEDLNDQISQRNPFSSVSGSLDDFKFQDKKLKALKEQLEYYKEQGAASEVILRIEKQIEETQSARAKKLGELNKDVNNIGKIGQQAVSAGNDVIGMLSDLGVEVSDNTKKGIDGVSMMVDAMAEIDFTKPMSVVSSAIKATAGQVKLYTAIFGKNPDYVSEETFARYERLIDTISEVIDKQRELLISLSGSAATAQYDQAVNLINKQIEATENLGKAYLNSGAGTFSHSYGYNLAQDLKKYRSEFNAIGIDFDSLGGRMTGLFDLTSEQLELIKEQIPEAWATLDDKTREYLQTIIDSKDEISDLADSLQESITGISFDTVKDSLDDLIQNVDSTWADVASSFQDQMKKSVLSFVKSSYLTDELKKWYDQFTKAYSDNNLSAGDIASLEAYYKQIYETGSEMYNAALEAAGLSAASSNQYSGLSGSIKRDLTEETGTELAGLIRKQSDDIRVMRDLAKTSVNHLANIEANTSNMVVETRNAVSELKISNQRLENIVTNTQKDASARDLGV